MVVTLYDNSPGAVFQSFEASVGHTVGNQWQANGAGQISALRWRRAITGSGGGIDRLALYDMTTNTLLYETTSPTDDGTVGWQRHELPSVILPATGHQLSVARDIPTGRTYQHATIATINSAPAPLEIVSPGVLYTANNVFGPPTPNSNGSYLDATDLEFTAAEDVPSTVGTTETTLAQWLSNNSGTNTHQDDGLPWLTKAVLDIVHGVIGNTAGQLDATKTVSDQIRSLLTSTNHNLGTLWDLAGHLADLEIAAWQAFFGTGEQRLTGPNSAGGSAFYTADGQLVSQLVAEIWQRVRVLRNDVPFGLGDWEMTAEADFEDAIAFAEPADAYVLTVTSWQDTQPADAGPAGTWLHRLGWWCVLTGSLASSRAFVEFAEQLLSDNGRRMAGCAIQLRPGTLAHVQAWVLA